jgi:hypothetical protein
MLVSAARGPFPHAAVGGAPAQRQLLRPRLMAMTSSRAPRPTPPIRARRPFDLELLKVAFVTVVMFCLAMGLCIAVLIGVRELP